MTVSDTTTPPTHEEAPEQTDYGVVLGRYRLVRPLGRGGMSTVYEGFDQQLGRPVAVKLLAAHLSADPTFCARLLAEARALAKLPHPRIVRVLDAGGGQPAAPEHEGAAPPPAGAHPLDSAIALVMELVRGESLRDRIERGPLPVEQAVEVAAQVAEALAFAHERGIVHRDVKPHNILLASVPSDAAPAVSAKLADFGVARAMDATSSLTATGVVLGSAPYLAPELLHGQPASSRTDVYALGVTLFQALTGHLPFEAATTTASLSRRLVQDAPRLRALRPEAPYWLDALVAHTLARQPERRPPSAAGLAEALRLGDAAASATTAVFSSASQAPTAVMRTPVRGAAALGAAATGRHSAEPSAPRTGVSAFFAGRSRAALGAAAAALLVLVAAVPVARGLGGWSAADQPAVATASVAASPTALPSPTVAPTVTPVPVPTATAAPPIVRNAPVRRPPERKHGGHDD